MVSRWWQCPIWLTRKSNPVPIAPIAISLTTALQAQKRWSPQKNSHHQQFDIEVRSNRLARSNLYFDMYINRIATLYLKLKNYHCCMTKPLHCLLLIPPCWHGNVGTDVGCQGLGCHGNRFGYAGAVIGIVASLFQKVSFSWKIYYDTWGNICMKQKN